MVLPLYIIGRQWLAELDISIPKFHLNKIGIGRDKHESLINEIFSGYSELFDGGLGCFTGGKATLQVREGAVPMFCRARPLPYAQRARGDAELDIMLRAGIIEPVECSDWATPLVIVNKSDGAIRICADYKVTLNRVLSVDKYPVPKIEDLFSNLRGNQYFSKLELSQAYSQVMLDDTKRYTVINTHRGLFMYNRLVFGLASSPGIFQRLMMNVLSDIPNVLIFQDDVLIGNNTWSGHVDTLNRVLTRLNNFGLKIKKEKCVFFVDKVKYLGYIDTNCISVDPEKVAPYIKNVRAQRCIGASIIFGYGQFLWALH